MKLTPNPFGLDSFAQGWDGFWKRLVTPESIKTWDDYFGSFDPHKEFDWQIVTLWNSGREIRRIVFHVPLSTAREASGRVVQGWEHPMTPELQRLEFEALRRQHTPTKKPR
ncbi:MAG: hypothetical protein J0M24_19780 [Verrucomicrobia bacterium]|nr:hypothetical protein [Verrucomicrobiota bacterium]